MQTNQALGTSYEQNTLPFGTALNNESTLTNNNKRFTSYDRSNATGLDYAINRNYDSKQGRFTQVDPIGMGAVSLAAPQTLNMYTYCGNDPINYTDPMGLFFGKFFKWLGKLIMQLFKSKVAKKIAVKFVVSFIISGGNFGVAIRSVAPDILRQLGLNPNLTPSWNPNLRHPISIGVGSLSRYIIVNFSDLVKEPGVLKILYCLLRAAGWLLNKDDNTERAAWIVKKDDGSYEAVRWPWSAKSNQEVWTGPIPKGAVAIVHTHPPRSSPKPSDTGGNTGKGDHGTADKIKLPVYVITRLAIWKAVPGDKDPTSVISGDWWKNLSKEKPKCD